LDVQSNLSPLERYLNRDETSLPQLHIFISSCFVYVGQRRMQKIVCNLYRQSNPTTLHIFISSYFAYIGQRRKQTIYVQL